MSENKATPIQPTPDAQEPARDNSEPTLKTPSISPADAEKLASKYQASWDQFTPTPEALNLSQEPGSTSDSGAWSRGEPERRASDNTIDGKLDPDQTGRTSAVPMSSARRSPIVWGMAGAAAIVILLIVSLIVLSQHDDEGQAPAEGSFEAEVAREAQSGSGGRLQPEAPPPAPPAPQAPIAAPPPAPPAPVVAAPPPPPPPPAPVVAAPPPPPPPPRVVAPPAPTPPPPRVVAQPTQRPAPPVVSQPTPRPAPATSRATAPHSDSPATQRPTTPSRPRRPSGGFISDNPY